MTYILHYASKTHMKITSVRMLSEVDVREWFGKVASWLDVVRVRCGVENGEVFDDQVFDSRIIDPENPEREESVRELADRMDRVFVAERMFKHPADRGEQKATTLTVNDESAKKCRCSHLRVQHGGSGSDGRCHADQCRCNRFWRAS